MELLSQHSLTTKWNFLPHTKNSSILQHGMFPHIKVHVNKGLVVGKPFMFFKIHERLCHSHDCRFAQTEDLRNSETDV